MYLVSVVCECAAFYEYILLILYIRWIVYIINEQILLRHSTISTLRDMYLEVIDCLIVINRSIYGLPVISTIIATNIGRLFYEFYNHILFPVPAYEGEELITLTISLSICVFDIIVLYGIGHATEQEVFNIIIIVL